jgi:heme a synthase
MTNLLPNLSNSFPNSSSTDATDAPARQNRLGIALIVLAGCTLCLMALGSATRVMNAGLSCPDWPLCYGTMLPSQQMNLQVFLEWFHRLIAATVGFGILTLSAIALRWRAQLPNWLPWSMALALGLVVFQGILGGLTVTELLRFDIVTAHLGTGLAFFATLLTIGLCLINYTQVNYTRSNYTGSNSIVNTRSIGWVGLVAASLVYLQSLLGGLVASQWAVHQCFGRMQLCGVMNRHIVGVFPATIATIGLIGWATWVQYQAQRAFKSESTNLSNPSKSKIKLHPWLKACIHTAATLLILQVSLGVTTFRLHLQVEILTVLHQAVGAALLGSLIASTVLALRQATPESQALN